MERCNADADESIVFHGTAESAVLRDVEKLRKIKPVVVQVALKEHKEAQIFTFSHKWTVSRLLHYLSVGLLVLFNVYFIVADNELAENDLVIGQPILKHLGICSKTMLEHIRAS